MVFGIEPGAPRDSGAMVTFIACPSTAEYPEQREGQPPSIRIEIDNVNRELVPQIRGALGTRQYIQILYREYLGSDLTEPAYGPIEFELRDVQMVGASLTGTAMVHNLQSKRFPKISKITITSSSRACCRGGAKSMRWPTERPVLRVDRKTFGLKVGSGIAVEIIASTVGVISLILIRRLVDRRGPRMVVAPKKAAAIVGLCGAF
jgi:hypothetical protein